MMNTGVKPTKQAAGHVQPIMVGCNVNPTQNITYIQPPATFGFGEGQQFNINQGQGLSDKNSLSQQSQSMSLKRPQFDIPVQQQPGQGSMYTPAQNTIEQQYVLQQQYN